jgi:glycosyltransferase involved in cell wall biosynthesis
MKIAILTPEYPPGGGGLATFYFHLSHMLADQGHEVVVFTTGEQRHAGDKLKILVVDYRLAGNVINWVIHRILYRCLEVISRQLAEAFLWNVYVWLQFQRENKTTRFDIIHASAYGISGFLVHILLPNIPQVVHLHGEEIVFQRFQSPMWQKKLLSWLETIYVKNVSILVACSDYYANEITPLIGRPVHVIPNFLSSWSKVQERLPGARKRMIYLGRLEWRKGVDIAVKTFVKLARTDAALELHLIGGEGAGIRYSHGVRTFMSYVNMLHIPATIRSNIFIGQKSQIERRWIDFLKL